MVHQAAWERNFFGAKQPRLCLGGGLPVNWTIQQHLALCLLHADSPDFSARPELRVLGGVRGASPGRGELEVL